MILSKRPRGRRMPLPPSAFDELRLDGQEPHLRFFYFGLLTLRTRSATAPATPEILRQWIYMAHDRCADADINAWLDQLQRLEIIRRYEHRGEARCQLLLMRRSPRRNPNRPPPKRPQRPRAGDALIQPDQFDPDDQPESTGAAPGSAGAIARSGARGAPAPEATQTTETAQSINDSDHKPGEAPGARGAPAPEATQTTETAQSINDSDHKPGEPPGNPERARPPALQGAIFTGAQPTITAYRKSQLISLVNSLLPLDAQQQRILVTVHKAFSFFQRQPADWRSYVINDLSKIMGPATDPAAAQRAMFDRDIAAYIAADLPADHPHRAWALAHVQHIAPHLHNQVEAQYVYNTTIKIVKALRKKALQAQNAGQR